MKLGKGAAVRGCEERGCGAAPRLPQRCSPQPARSRGRAAASCAIARGRAGVGGSGRQRTFPPCRCAEQRFRVRGSRAGSQSAALARSCRGAAGAVRPARRALRREERTLPTATGKNAAPAPPLGAGSPGLRLPHTSVFLNFIFKRFTSR